MASATTPRSMRSASTEPRNWLAEIRTEVKPRPTAMVFYGAPGIGKTSFAAHAPGAVFLTDDKEDGITTLKNANLVPNVPQLPPAKSWADVMGMLDALATGEHNHKCIVVDALGGIERLCHEEVCRRDYNGEWGDRGFGSYQKGFDTSLADIRLLINALDRLRNERSMSVILLGHARVATFKNPEGPDYDRYSVDVHSKTWALLNRWADMVLFGNFVTVVKPDSSKGKGKATGGQMRTIYTTNHASYDAKNRNNLPEEIPMGDSAQDAWANFVAAVKEGKKLPAAA